MQIRINTSSKILMGNLWCLNPNGYMIDCTKRKVVASQAVQCSLLMPNKTCFGKNHSMFDSIPEDYINGSVLNPSGDSVASQSCYKSSNKKYGVSSKSKTKLNKKADETNDALVSLSETVSESSMEVFLHRKHHLKQKKKKINMTKATGTGSDNKMTNDSEPLEENNIFKNSQRDLKVQDVVMPVKELNSKIRKIIRTRKTVTKPDIQLEIANKLPIVEPKLDQINASNYNELNISAEVTSTNESCSQPQLIKSLIKNIEKEINRGDLDASNEKIRNVTHSVSLVSERFTTHSIQNQTVSANENGDSIEELMSILRTSTSSVLDDAQLKSKSVECLLPFQNVKSVNFTSDTRSPKILTFKNNDDTELSDGRIKKRFILRETHKLFDILNDPNDRRIRSICDRHQCDLEIFVRPPKIGLMYFAVEIIAANKFAMRMCVRELDSSMKWCIASQLF